MSWMMDRLHQTTLLCYMRPTYVRLIHYARERGREGDLIRSSHIYIYIYIYIYNVESLSA